MDLGSGSGGFLENISSKSKVAIDLSKEMIELHKKALPNATYLVANVESGIPLPSKSIDLVHSSFLIDHISDLSKFFSEVNRVLKSENNLFLLSYHSPKIMTKYREEKSFKFKTTKGIEYHIYSDIPNFSSIKKFSSPYFNLLAKKTISMLYDGEKVGFDYLVFGAKK